MTTMPFKTKYPSGCMSTYSHNSPLRKTFFSHQRHSKKKGMAIHWPQKEEYEPWWCEPHEQVSSYSQPNSCKKFSSHKTSLTMPKIWRVITLQTHLFVIGGTHEKRGTTSHVSMRSREASTSTLYVAIPNEYWHHDKSSARENGTSKAKVLKWPNQQIIVKGTSRQLRNRFFEQRCLARR